MTWKYVICHFPELSWTATSHSEHANVHRTLQPVPCLSLPVLQGTSVAGDQRCIPGWVPETEARPHRSCKTPELPPSAPASPERTCIYFFVPACMGTMPSACAASPLQGGACS